MAEPWCADEIAWARECFLSGDSLEEIATWSGRTLREVMGVIGTGRNISPRNREILSLYTAGCSFPEIAQERGGSWKSAAASITHLRRQGLRIPHRNSRIAEAKGQPGIRAA
jgi:DNA-binding NarL/FixJ family response regulator